MDKKLKSKWVDALRSGKFTQGKGVLHDPAKNTYCCLGVLHIAAGIPVSFIEDKAFGRSNSLIGDDMDLKFVKMNDSQDKTFSEIADYIEKNIPATLP